MRAEYERMEPRRKVGGGTWKAIIGTVAATSLFWVLGFSAFGGQGGGDAPALTTSAPTTVKENVAKGFAHTCEGAVGAAGSYYQTLNKSSVALDVGAYRAAVEEMAVGEGRSKMLGAIPTAIEPYADGAIGEQYRAGVETVQLGTPISYAIENCEPDSARIRIWTVSIRGNASNVWPMQFWNTHFLQMSWTDGDWKIASGSFRDGPVPYWTQHPKESKLANQRDVMDVAKEMKPYVTLP